MPEEREKATGENERKTEFLTGDRRWRIKHLFGSTQQQGLCC